MNKLLIALLALSLTGCASQQLAANDAKGVPFNRVMKQDLLKQQPGTVEVVFVREDATLRGIAGSLNVWANGEPLVSLHLGEAVKLWMKPDFYVFTLTTNTRGSVQFQPFELKYLVKKVEVDAKVNRRYEARLDTSSAGLVMDISSTPVDK